MKLKNYVSIITGVNATSGLGNSFAKAFAAEGSDLILCHHGSNKEECCMMEEFADTLMRDTGREIMLFAGDISNEATVIDLVDKSIIRFNKIDVLINAAGISHQSLLKDMSLEDWNRTIQVDLTSVFLTCRYVVPHMLERKFGRIINIASQVGHKGALECCHYAAAKAGVHGFTKSLARELGSCGITVNCISPGPINTNMLANTKADWVQRKKEELVIPRIGEVEEVAPTAVMLAAIPDGNLYTGQSLGPNCGDVML